MGTRWRRLAALAVVIGTAVTACGGQGAEKAAIRGDFSLQVGSTRFGCGGAGFADISPDAQVVLYDARGAVVATTRLGGADLTGSSCDFEFAFPPIKVRSEFYAVEVAHRGKITKSVADLRAAGWRYGLSLG